ncbi:DNA-binding protein [Aureimonas endophytica]|uniref:DNA-binding protein n=1 Tax=Aureimonas endophytica TaxID=2027858 RepID=A0A916ZKU3_9HYPH|nr:DNA-binding protein [Aureimonas endophytica]
MVHALGVILTITGSMALLTFAVGHMTRVQTAGAVVYLATLMLSIGVSAAYNIWPVSRTKWLLRRLDHSAIYLLIAGTYTPFMIEMKAYAMLSCVWAISLAGVTLKLLCPGRFDRSAIGLYLALGWSGIFMFTRITETLSSTVIVLILAGGVVYSLGVLFHVWERLRFQNAIWHSFVLTAAAIHFVAVWRSLVA